ncbi:MAG TPA: GAF domain-containing protein [Pirellula sp.]|nr:GAF domain-containing protein [Pirellula sp.]
MVAFAGYPLLVGEEVVGVMAMFARVPISENVLVDLRPIADSIAQFINRKRAEAALRESNERVTNVLASITFSRASPTRLFLGQRHPHGLRRARGRGRGRGVSARRDIARHWLA